jgi:hypothetical protein
VIRALRWYLAELFGDTAYDKYVARHELTHTGEGSRCAPRTRREV